MDQDEPLTAAEIERARIARLNEPVEVEALGLISFDGDPATEGSEYYAPAGWQPEDPEDDASWTDAEGKSLRDLPIRFATTRIQAEALVKAGAVRIVTPDHG